MSGPNELPKGYNRYRDALHIVDPGACNPSGIALALHNACRQVIEEGGDQQTDPAIRLICTQLSWLVKGNWDAEDYGALMDACRSKAAERADAGTA